MTDEQLRLLELLEEFDVLCGEADASYSLIDRTLLYSTESVEFRGCEADVAMLYSEFRKFILAFEKSITEGREIESLNNNPKMPGWYFRYVDSSTTCFSFDYAHVRRAHGVGINIHIARKADSTVRGLSSRFVERGLKSCIHYSYKRFQVDRPFDPVARIFVQASRKVLGESLVSECALEMFEQSALEDPKDPSLLFMPEARTVHLPAGFFEETTRITLQGRRFSVSKLSEEYLRTRFAKSPTSRFITFATKSVTDLLKGNFRAIPRHVKGLVSSRVLQEKNPPYRREDLMNFCSTNVPYAEYITSVQPLIDDKTFWRVRESWLRNWVFSIGWRKYLEQKRWDSLFLIMDRYEYWERYTPHKGAIEKLYRAGYFDVLWEYLRSYRDKVELYANKGFAFIVDELIWEVLIALYEKNGKTKLAKRLKAMEASNKLEPIAGVEANRYLASHKPSGNEIIEKLAIQACSANKAKSKAIMFIDRLNSTGDMEKLLLYCLGQELHTEYQLVYAVPALSYVEHLVSINQSVLECVYFVVKNGIEYKRYLGCSNVLLAADVLPRSFEKGQGQEIVLLLSPDFAWDWAKRPRYALETYVPMIAKTDVLVGPEDLVRQLAELRASQSRDSLGLLFGDYCRYYQCDTRASAQKWHVVASFVNARQLARWGSFCDVQEFSRRVAASIGTLSCNVAVRLSAMKYEELVRVDSPDANVVDSCSDIAGLLNGARLLITDNLDDLAVAHYMGVPSLLVGFSDSFKKEYAERQGRLHSPEVLFSVSIENVFDVLSSKRPSIKESVPLQTRHDVALSPEQLFMSLEAFAVDGRVALSQRVETKLNDLLLLKWDDSDEFHSFICSNAIETLTTLLIANRTVWLLDSDADAMYRKRVTTYFRKDDTGDTRSFQNVNFSKEWEKLFGRAIFDRLFVPQGASGFWLKMLEHASAESIVHYDSFEELKKMLSKQ